MALTTITPGTRLDVVHAWRLPAGSWGATLLGQARFLGSTVRETAERGGHELIVVGVDGNRGFHRLRLGSAAETTVRQAHCSALVVHGGP
jgi:hypothetical protein